MKGLESIASSLFEKIRGRFPRVELGDETGAPTTDESKARFFDFDFGSKDKPIGLFIQIATRMFLYHLFMPADKDHVKLKNWLKRNWKGKKENIKRITTQVKKIEKILDKTVFKKYATK